MGETRAERPFTADRSCLRASQGGAEPEVAPRSAMQGAPAEGDGGQFSKCPLVLFGKPPQVGEVEFRADFDHRPRSVRTGDLLLGLFQPNVNPSAGMTCWPVSPRVGNAKNRDPSLIERVSS